MNLAIIPARGGSRRIPGKNIRLFHGKPIIAYSIETARESGLFDKIIVSTEDTRNAAVARYYGAKIHARAIRLADDLTGTQEVAKAALANWIACRNTEAPEFVCCIYATAPMLKPEDLASGLAMLEAHPYVYLDGIYYWGRADAFASGVPLAEGLRIVSDDPRFIDINVESDWQRAEALYRDLKQSNVISAQIDQQVFEEVTR